MKNRHLMCIVICMYNLSYTVHELLQTVKSGVQHIFGGNVDAHSRKINEFDYPLLTSRIKVKPYAWNVGIGLAFQVHAYKMEGKKVNVTKKCMHYVSTHL